MGVFAGENNSCEGKQELVVVLQWAKFLSSCVTTAKNSANSANMGESNGKHVTLGNT